MSHDDDDDDAEPEYELEQVQVTQRSSPLDHPDDLDVDVDDLTLAVWTMVPPPVEYLANLHTRRQEISGRQVWTGSLLLARYLLWCQHHRHQGGPHGVLLLLQGQRILELGAGTGILGMALARQCRPRLVVCTDGGDEQVLNLLRQNVRHNQVHNILATPLWWTDDASAPTNKAFADFAAECKRNWPDAWSNNNDNDGMCVVFDVVVAGDVLYKPELPSFFFATVHHFLTNQGVLYLCHVPRASISHAVVQAAAQQAGFLHSVVMPTAAGGPKGEEAVVVRRMVHGLPVEDVQRARIYRMTKAL